MSKLHTHAKTFYEAPTVDIIDLQPQTMLCASGDYLFYLEFDETGGAGKINGVIDDDYDY